MLTEHVALIEQRDRSVLPFELGQYRFKRIVASRNIERQ